jgi:hypothetical protein
MNTILIIISVITYAAADYGDIEECESLLIDYTLYGDLIELNKCADAGSAFTKDHMVAASCKGHYDVVEWLLKRGTEKHHWADDLICAAGLGYTGIVKMLLVSDVDYLKRPFIFAVSNNHPGVVQVLLDAGADPNGVVHCYYHIPHAPERLYEGVIGYVRTCDELADIIMGEGEKEGEEEGEGEEDAEEYIHEPPPCDYIPHEISLNLKRGYSAEADGEGDKQPPIVVERVGSAKKCPTSAHAEINFKAHGCQPPYKIIDPSVEPAVHYDQ